MFFRNQPVRKSSLLAINPVPTGRSILSKSFRGSASSAAAETEIINEFRRSPVILYDTINTDRKQAILPATVLPPEKGMRIRPNIFPTMLDKLSPNANAKIAMVAAGSG